VLDSPAQRSRNSRDQDRSIILGITRPNRNGEQVARWVYDIASRRDDGSFDWFVMVTPEYNHSTSGVLKNAIDYLSAKRNKAVGFVSYGAVGGARAAEHPVITTWPRWIPC
jgi:hypothetical protein